MKLKGKTILITGATGGIGSVLASHLAHEKAHLILLGRNQDKLKALLKNLENSRRHTTYSCNLTNRSARSKLAAKLAQAYPQLDLLIHAAGIGIYKPIETVTLSDWDKSLALNAEAPYFLTQTLLPNLARSPHSLVVAMGSGAGVIPMGGRSLYCLSKFALRGAFLSLAEEFKGTKTHFILITLGSTLTPFGPLNLAEKQQKSLQGKAYFTPEWVAAKLVEIIGSKTQNNEYTLYPNKYGFGTRQKP